MQTSQSQLHLYHVVVTLPRMNTKKSLNRIFPTDFRGEKIVFKDFLGHTIRSLISQVSFEFGRIFARVGKECSWVSDVFLFHCLKNTSDHIQRMGCQRMKEHRRKNSDTRVRVKRSNFRIQTVFEVFACTWYFSHHTYHSPKEFTILKYYDYIKHDFFSLYGCFQKQGYP